MSSGKLRRDGAISGGVDGPITSSAFEQGEDFRNFVFRSSFSSEEDWLCDGADSWSGFINGLGSECGMFAASIGLSGAGSLR